MNLASLLLCVVPITDPAYVIINVDIPPGVDVTLLVNGVNVKPNEMIVVHPKVAAPTVKLTYKVGYKVIEQTATIEDMKAGDVSVIQVALPVI